jgi:monothiol glutaredoxin
MFLSRIVTLTVAAAVWLTLVALPPQGADAFAPALPTPARSVALRMSDDLRAESPADTQERIQALVDNHPVLLFMKGSKLFPQCGFSNTAVQILDSFKIDFHAVDVLADEAIRQGVKEFSAWPTIPQLVCTTEFLSLCGILLVCLSS